MNKHIKKAVDLVGSQAELARQIKKSSVFVNDMLYSRKRVPSELCRVIESSTGGQVTCHDLRPDVFGEAPKSKKVLARRSDVLRADALDWEDAV